MEYLGDKLSVAHSQVSGWMGNVRRSLQGALNLVSSGVERGGAEDGGGGFKRAASLRGLASRSRESFRRFSLRSQQRLSLRRRPTDPGTPTSVRDAPPRTPALIPPLPSLPYALFCHLLLLGHCVIASDCVQHLRPVIFQHCSGHPACLTVPWSPCVGELSSSVAPPLPVSPDSLVFSCSFFGFCTQLCSPRSKYKVLR